ncbi:MAG: hypothetical protein LUE87_06160 [Lachnospiraceae bacterium]|nr:hypothetical protein [Lachnospiraceae bacterium]
MMQRLLWTRCGWEDGFTYRVSGTLHSEYGVVEFDLNTAERVMEPQAAENESEVP